MFVFMAGTQLKYEISTKPKIKKKPTFGIVCQQNVKILTKNVYCNRIIEKRNLKKKIWILLIHCLSIWHCSHCYSMNIRIPALYRTRRKPFMDYNRYRQMHDVKQTQYIAFERSQLFSRIVMDKKKCYFSKVLFFFCNLARGCYYVEWNMHRIM